MKRGILTIFILLLALGIAIYGFNYIQLQSKMNSVIKADPRNEGIKVTVHFGTYVNLSKLIYNLKSVSATNSMADVFRVSLQFAEKMCSRDFKEVVLAYKGTAKFKIDGDYFQKLGKEYSWQNPVYTMCTFPENLKNLDGSQAYGQWTGGLLGVLKEQMEDFNDFHRKWYLDDITK